jgi:hypothetical protein
MVPTAAMADLLSYVFDHDIKATVSAAPPAGVPKHDDIGVEFEFVSPKYSHCKNTRRSLADAAVAASRLSVCPLTEVRSSTLQAAAP